MMDSSILVHFSLLKQESKFPIIIELLHHLFKLGIPGGLSGKESICQCRRHRFELWIGKNPRRRKWQHILVFLPGKFHEQRSLVGYSPQGHRIRHNLVTEHSTLP